MVTYHSGFRCVARADIPSYAPTELKTDKPGGSSCRHAVPHASYRLMDGRRMDQMTRRDCVMINEVFSIVSSHFLVNHRGIWLPARSEYLSSLDRLCSPSSGKTNGLYRKSTGAVVVNALTVINLAEYSLLSLELRYSVWSGIRLKSRRMAHSSHVRLDNRRLRDESVSWEYKQELWYSGVEFNHSEAVS